MQIYITYHSRVVYTSYTDKPVGLFVAAVSRIIGLMFSKK